MADISAVIITFNEEAYIENALASLEGIADEIVVVDSNSTDSTEDICRKFNVRFIKHDFEGYSEQKNYAVSQAVHSLVLSLDADEALNDELRASILGVKNDPGYDGYVFNRRSNYCGKWMRHSGLYPDRHLRLFNPAKGRWMGPNPHDKFYLDRGCRSRVLKGNLLHWNYNSFEEHNDKMNRFSTISANEYFRAGRRVLPCTATFHMIWRFIRSYLLEGGFLNGHKGFIFSAITAWSSFLKYAKLYRLNSENNV